jgi:hypothetical protein
MKERLTLWMSSWRIGTRVSNGVCRKDVEMSSASDWIYHTLLKLCHVKTPSCFIESTNIRYKARKQRQQLF